MTNQPTTTEATEEPNQAPADSAAPPEEEPTEEEDHGTGNEAARYRRRLRDTEGERDTLRGQVETLQRAEVERIAGAKLTVPAGLWSIGTELADLIGEDGNVDTAKVTAAADAAQSEHGLEANRTRGNVVPNEGATPDPYPPGGFADSLA